MALKLVGWVRYRMWVRDWMARLIWQVTEVISRRGMRVFCMVKPVDVDIKPSPLSLSLSSFF